MSRGFAAMSEERRREIARKGGKAAHEQGRAYQFTSEKARAAGRKGGSVVSADRAHMAEIGRKGGSVVSADRAHMAEIGRKGGQAVCTPEHMGEIGRKGVEARRRSAGGAATSTAPLSEGYSVDGVVDAVVGWWLSSVNGERTGSSGAPLVDGLLGLFGPQTSTSAGDLQAFERELRRLVREELLRRGDCYLSTDYGPEGLLRAACAATVGAIRFPIKTSMTADLRWGVVVSCGYRAPDERILGLPVWKVDCYSATWDSLRLYFGTSEEEARAVWQVVAAARLVAGVGSCYLKKDSNVVDESEHVR